jgi:hypothetical protein
VFYSEKNPDSNVSSAGLLFHRLRLDTEGAAIAR